MSDELYYTPSTLEERIARARARRAEEERAIVALEAKELEVAAEAERLRNKEPLDDEDVDYVSSLSRRET
jgi:hypothetical protein